MLHDLITVINTYVIIVLVQIVFWPYLCFLSHKLLDGGWPLARIISGLGISLSIWFLGYLKLPLNTNQGVTLMIILAVAAPMVFKMKLVKDGVRHLKNEWRLVLFEEVLFLSTFAGYTIVRGYQPDILGLEKFMDFGFVKSYLNSPTLPAKDMWYAGESINYYSFGHFWTSIMVRVFGVSAEVGYNLMLAFVMATSMVLVFSIVVNLIGGVRLRSIYSGLIGALLVILGGNSHTIWYALTKNSLEGYWYADATRFIHNTIHEFPSYSFVVSDLHGHVLDLPIVLSFLLLLIIWHRDGKSLIVDSVIGILLGVMAMTNTWDLLVYGLLLIFYSIFRLVTGKSGFLELVKKMLIIGAATGVTVWPWAMEFKPISSGVAAVVTRTPLWQLLALWSIHVLTTLWAMLFGATKTHRNILILSLGLTAITLLLIPEFVYVKDIYPDHPRANTMFKLTYQAFIMMGIVFGWLSYEILTHGNKISRTISSLVLGIAFVSLMIFPAMSFPTYYGNFVTFKGLDGFSFLRERFPDDLSLIRYLEANRDGRNLVERVGDSYSETNFISALGGVPTVVGWRVHEWLWRGGFDPIAKREEEVRKVYEGNDDERIEIIKKYNVGWIVVTDRERESYGLIKESKLMEMGRVVWSSNDNYLISVQ